MKQTPATLYTPFDPSSNTPIFKVHRVIFTNVYENEESTPGPSSQEIAHLPPRRRFANRPKPPIYNWRILG